MTAPPPQQAPAHPKLSQLPATAICGNDISSSCLYVSALAIVYAGAYAWISLLMVGGVLYLFRRIYGEVVGAIPLNGGAYNALLNTTSKSVASLAASLTLLSYMATAVISASEASHYVHEVVHSVDIVTGTIILLALFMVLTIIGIGESSKVAIAIFVFHIASLVILVLVTGVHVLFEGLSTLVANYEAPLPGSIGKALFFGFAASMLGISGFESSANYVEEQADGIFPKTLRNMWVVVTVFNPLTAFLALAVVPLADVTAHEEALLAHMGNVSGGAWLAWLISVDAALVLSGAVLTSFVGVGGLVSRMALDRILPQFLLRVSSRGTTHRIMIAFFLLCVSILLITRGELGALAGVYTISFLSVMALFGLGNVLLKVRRARLPRPERATLPGLLLAIVAVLLALLGNALLNPYYLAVFLEYFVPTFGLVLAMIFRVSLLQILLSTLKYLSDPVMSWFTESSTWIASQIDRINAQQFVFFSKGENVAGLNRVMHYVEENEHSKRLKIVTILPEGAQIPETYRKDVEVLDRAHPEINIEFIVLNGAFGPQLIEDLSREWKIPKNFMFIGSPGDRFPYQLAALGGVRLII